LYFFGTFRATSFLAQNERFVACFADMHKRLNQTRETVNNYFRIFSEKSDGQTKRLVLQLPRQPTTP